MGCTIWIDVEDLFDYVRHSARPSGIQRLAFEIYRELRAIRGDAVRFLRHAEEQNSFVVVSWAEVDDLFNRLANVSAPARRQAIAPTAVTSVPLAYDAAETPPPFLRLIRPAYLPVISLLPAAVRTPLASFVWFQGQSFGVLAKLPLEWMRPVREKLARGRRQRLVAALENSAKDAGAQPRLPPSNNEALRVWDFEKAVRPGDTLLILGSPWFKVDYAELLNVFSERGGLVGVLLYDIIPLRRPEWCDQALVRRFASWFATVLPRADMLFAISTATANDIRRYAAASALPISDQITVVPIGSGFGDRLPEPAPDVASAPLQRTLPPAGSYVLFVSTIEARKNHALMFRVWRRLLEELPEQQVPTLVFAGRVGWLVADLMQQLRNTNFLDGKLLLIEKAVDSEMETLYRGCLFTVFPSFYEGWGLPVTESLRFGKPCVIADNTSLPEAGGSLAKYFDAEDPHQAFRVIRDVIADREALADWEARVIREFRPVPWRATANAIVTVLDDVTESAAPTVPRMLAPSAGLNP